MVDLDALKALLAKAKLGPMESVHIISPGYEHCANLCSLLPGHKSSYPLAMMQAEWSDVIAESVNAAPDLIAEIEAAREVVKAAKAALENTKRYVPLESVSEVAVTGSDKKEVEFCPHPVLIEADQALAAIAAWEEKHGTR